MAPRPTVKTDGEGMPEDGEGKYEQPNLPPSERHEGTP